ncbi:MAG: hypothetical protein IKW30_10960 [Lachnospiraceae bacterium]|nr:hypothetical protein [Lachnospiraceae bacterium]
MIKYEFNGKKLNIPKAEIEKSMKVLGLSKDDAIQMWLEDEGYLENEEQENLCKLAKENKITATIHQASGKTEKKQSKPRTVKISDEKQALFKDLVDFLTESNQNVEILKENKLIQVKIGEKTFKIDLIEQRSPKKSTK